MPRPFSSYMNFYKIDISFSYVYDEPSAPLLLILNAIRKKDGSVDACTDLNYFASNVRFRGSNVQILMQLIGLREATQITIGNFDNRQTALKFVELVRGCCVEAETWAIGLEGHGIY